MKKPTAEAMKAARAIAAQASGEVVDELFNRHLPRCPQCRQDSIRICAEIIDREAGLPKLLQIARQGQAGCGG